VFKIADFICRQLFWPNQNRLTLIKGILFLLETRLGRSLFFREAWGRFRPAPPYGDELTNHSEPAVVNPWIIQDKLCWRSCAETLRRIADEIDAFRRETRLG
jgi:hypothetical protein